MNFLHETISKFPNLEKNKKNEESFHGIRIINSNNINEYKTKSFFNKIKSDEIIENQNNINLDIKKPEISSEEFFMRRSQMNYIKNNLSPVKSPNVSKNINMFNTNNSTRRVFSSKINKPIFKKKSTVKST